LSEKERERAQAGGGTEGEVEAGSPVSRESDTGFNPRTPGSRPELKADVYRLSHGGTQSSIFLQ